MAQQTNCPACGAPLEYTGDQDEVRCGFCGAELRVTHVDGEHHFEVLSQPGPQKEVLSQPVKDLGVPPSDTPPAMDAWGFPTSGAQVYGQSASQVYDNPTPSTSAMPSTTSIPAAPYAPVSTSTSAPTSRSATNWVLIVVAVLAAICLMLACMGGLLFTVFRAR